MNKVTRYQTRDGLEFPTGEAAAEHEQLLDDVEEAMSPLGDTPQAVKDGEGWVQHDPETVLAARDTVLDLARKHGVITYIHKSGRECHPLSIVGRILSDHGGPLARAWGRVARIDPDGREHQQSYFAYEGAPEHYHRCVEDRPPQQTSHHQQP